MLALALILLQTRTIQVGDGKQFSDLESALMSAQPGDTIQVFPKESGYRKVALLISKPRIHIVGKGGTKIILDGTGFEYSGVGTIPRAIVQFNSGSLGSSLTGFVLHGAHNKSFNGSGVRISDASEVAIENCEIDGNDMGIMSDGNATQQTIQNCHVHDNGTNGQPGYNHNLYLGGISATVNNCEIDHALTGHDLKSRTHFLLVENCYLHDSPNRELDIVESEATKLPHSNAVLLNNLIVKNNLSGNGNVIQFGHESGSRNGQLWALGNTILTKSPSSVFLISDSQGSIFLEGNVLKCKVQSNPQFVTFSNRTSKGKLLGSSNWISFNYTEAQLEPLRIKDQVPSPPNSSSLSLNCFYEDGDGGKHSVKFPLGYSGHK